MGWAESGLGPYSAFTELYCFALAVCKGSAFTVQVRFALYHILKSFGNCASVFQYSFAVLQCSLKAFAVALNPRLKSFAVLHSICATLHCIAVELDPSLKSAPFYHSQL